MDGHGQPGVRSLQPHLGFPLATPIPRLKAAVKPFGRSSSRFFNGKKNNISLDGYLYYEYINTMSQRYKLALGQDLLQNAYERWINSSVQKRRPEKGLLAYVYNDVDGGLTVANVVYERPENLVQLRKKDPSILPVGQTEDKYSIFAVYGNELLDWRAKKGEPGIAKIPTLEELQECAADVLEAITAGKLSLASNRTNDASGKKLHRKNWPD